MAAMMRHVLELVANFESVKVVWADSSAALYSAKDIWRPLLSHEPLFMDPLNPYSNLADLNFFDSQEMSLAAQKPDAVECFQREAAKFLVRPAADGLDGSGENGEESS